MRPIRLSHAMRAQRPPRLIDLDLAGPAHVVPGLQRLLHRQRQPEIRPASLQAPMNPGGAMPTMVAGVPPTTMD